MESESLFFKSVTVRNIRCFGDEPQTLDLTDNEGKPAKWNLILGDNGVGKTTLLQALAVKYWVGQVLIPIYYQVLKKSELEVGFEKPDDSINRFSNKLGWHGVGHGEVEFVLNKERNPEDDKNFKFDFEQPMESSGMFPFPYEELFVCGYGPERKLSESDATDDELRPLAGLFYSIETPFKSARTWLRELDYSASKKTPVQNQMKERLNQIQELLIEVLPDVTDIRITDPTSMDPEPDVEFLTPYGWVELNSVAYGYQSLVAWIVDFAYRLIERYPDSSSPLSEPAICLVDELDLHLHPSWQRDVMGYLSDKFPNTQFIATVHSPLIVQAAPSMNANVAVLRRVEGEPFDHVVIDNDPEIIRSWRLDQLLTSDLFTTSRGPISPRNSLVQEKIDERRQILSKAKLTKSDKQRLGEITEEIDMVPVSETSEHKKVQQLLSDSYKLLAEESDVK